MVNTPYCAVRTNTLTNQTSPNGWNAVWGCDTQGEDRLLVGGVAFLSGHLFSFHCCVSLIHSKFKFIVY